MREEPQSGQNGLYLSPLKYTASTMDIATEDWL
jgi:hypothetical protein